MADYPMFLLFAALTVLSPGPGVLFTVGNAVNHGLAGAFAGSLGIAAGALIIGTLSMTGVGVVLSSSPLAFSVLKYAGAAYLISLGGRLIWSGPRSAAQSRAVMPETGQGAVRREDGFRRWGFRQGLEGVSLQLTNPKAVFFFLSVFPQFIDPRQETVRQSALLVVSYAVLVVGIHMGYAACAGQVQRPLSSYRGRLWVNRISGLAFLLFGGMMALARP